MIIRTLSAALVLASALAMPAFAQQNSSTTVQTGGTSLSRTDQRGTNNDATTVQIGKANGAEILQRGSVSNTAGCGQDGDLNVCDVQQRDRQGN